ncbi:NAD-dependent epimerase/dehydratase family protein [Curtobacterium sp. MCBA15_001]|uniref:NAD-dependent epimerase/dehydratase family protein n=1 Tax=Curtobacterium sp. MCBA15_001 TaxID=1898731 RepID=UPI0008DDFC6A|nr:NAD-dependent epimerase/dehydratase family protein [Curtobacterium sp. MCBA15_001]OIH96521.1 reductase [Curtobacterium sp. MCBA15_001]
MANALVLGGTGWLGQHLVRALLDDGHTVSCLARGTSGSIPDGARLVRADRRAAGAYDDVRGRWDLVVELSSDPALVAGALDALADDVAHWTFVSTVSVYAEDDQPDADESAALVEPADLSQYADAKVAAEQASVARLGDRLLVVRPGLIVGPGDPSDRFGYWPARLDQSGPALVPTTADRFAQVIDVRDLAWWIARTRTAGTVNAVGDPVPLAEVFRTDAAATGFDGEVVALEDDVLLAHGVQYWAGPRSLPLWLPHAASGFARRSNRAFRELGGTTRPLAATVEDVLVDERARGVTRARRSGLSRHDEAAVLTSR